MSKFKGLLPISLENRKNELCAEWVLGNSPLNTEERFFRRSQVISGASEQSDNGVLTQFGVDFWRRKK
jgi:hypothetical protein